MALEIEHSQWDNRQVCTVVKDVDKTVAYYASLGLATMSVRDWSGSALLYGKPSDMSLRIGLSDGGSVQLEVIQPHSNAVFHSSSLARRGEGGHHMGIYVSDLAAKIEGWAKVGVEPIFRGSNPKGTVDLAYMDTAGIGGVFFEFIQLAPYRFPRFAETPTLGTNLTEIRHVGVVVEDMEKTVAFYTSLGFGPFTVRERDLANLRVAGRPGTTTWSIKHTVSENCRIPIELIQPLGAGTLFHDSLAQQGEGIQHVCCRVPNLAGELERLESLGVRPLVANERLAYLDTGKTGGLMIELLERQSL
ncbi:MAG: VOC family protein [Dehalococcoidia bacterium]|nr:VOC family protein [Dehalococcoidia bacterium]